MKRAPRPPTCRHMKVESEVVDVEALKRKGVQGLCRNPTLREL
jgi:hypothetical protein